MSEQRVTRREIIKKAAYLAPIVLTVQANFSFASAGSGDYTDNDEKDKKEKKDNDDSKFKNYTNHNSR
jgi:hypothetical protein